jgi:hypothetical protein
MRAIPKLLGYSLVMSFLAMMLIMSIFTGQVQLAYAGGKSPYESGYDHGCDDARISDPSDRYINQPEKGPRFHTNEFMRGYNAGYNACSGNGDFPRGPVGGPGSGTPAEGQRDGKAEGYRDAISGRPSDDRCASGKSNAYCIAYKLAYDLEYWVTKNLPRK